MNKYSDKFNERLRDNALKFDMEVIQKYYPPKQEIDEVSLQSYDNYVDAENIDDMYNSNEFKKYIAKCALTDLLLEIYTWGFSMHRTITEESELVIECYNEYIKTIV